MTRRSTTSLLVTAGLMALSALPGALAAQSGASASSAARGSATITVEVDPWMVAWEKQRTQSAQTRVARANLRQLDDALEPYRMSYTSLTDGERIEIRRAFGDVLPGQRFTTYRINAPQARATRA